MDSSPETASRVTVNLSHKSVAALNAAVAATGDNRTAAINKAIQLWAEVQHAQATGGGVWIGTGASDPIRVRYQ